MRWSGLCRAAIRACLAAGVLVVSGCAHADEAPEAFPIADVTGHSLGDVTGHVDPDATLLVQDASPLVGREPSYNTSQQDSANWTILEGCSTDASIDASAEVELSVVPSDTYDQVVASAASDGPYTGTVTCEGLPEHSRPRA